MAKRFPYTQKTLKWASQQDWESQIVEKYCPFTRRRKDFMGIIDIISISEAEGIIGIQSTSYGQRKPHLATILVEQRDNTARWLKAGGRLLLVSWKKVKRVRGGTAFKYEPVVDEITLEML